MKEISPEEISKIARLARISITEEEARLMSGQLCSIMEHFARLQEVPVEGVSGTSHTIADANVFRSDQPQPNLPIEALLEMVPDRSGRFIKTPLVVDSEGA